MFNFKYITVVTMVVVTPKIQALEDYRNFIINSSNSLAETQSRVKKGNEELSTDKPSSSYEERVDEQHQFKELLGMYTLVRDKIEHPVQFDHAFLSSGTVFNVKPAFNLSDGMANTQNMKFMIQMSAYFL